MQLSEQINLKENSIAARLAAWKLGSNNVAMVFGNTIYLHHISKEEFLEDHRLVKHELKHVEQFARYGKFRFLCLYLIEWIKHGYYNNRYEKEAREAENED